MYRHGAFFVFAEHFGSVFYDLLGGAAPCKMVNRYSASNAGAGAVDGGEGDCGKS